MPTLYEIFLGMSSNERKEMIWGGVGIACIDWNQVRPNILAAVTLKTNLLEVWDVEKAVMVNIHELPKQVQMVRWSPHRENSLLAVAVKSAKLFLIDTLTGASEVIDYSKVVTKS